MGCRKCSFDGFTYGLLRKKSCVLLLAFEFASGSCFVGVKNMSGEPPPPSNPDLNEPVCGTGILDDDYGTFLLTILSTIPVTILFRIHQS